MAAITAGVLAVGATAYSANRSNAAASRQARSANEANQVQADQYAQQRTDNEPFRQAGVNALGRLDRFDSGDMSDFYTSPDYNFTKSEGMSNIQNYAGAQGGAFSGNALKALSEFNQNLASTQVGNWRGSQERQAGMGQQTVNMLGQAGQNYAANTGANTMAAGDARASGIVGGANAWNGLASWGAENAMYFKKPKPYGGHQATNYTPSRNGLA